MSNLRRRLKKLEPKPFSPVLVEWGFHFADGRIERGQGTFSDLDRAIFSNHSAEDKRGEHEQRTL